MPIVLLRPAKDSDPRMIGECAYCGAVYGALRSDLVGGKAGCLSESCVDRLREVTFRESLRHLEEVQLEAYLSGALRLIAGKRGLALKLNGETVSEVSRYELSILTDN